MKKLFYSLMLAAAASAIHADDSMIRYPLTAGGNAEEFRINARRPENFNRKPTEKATVKFDYDQNNIYFTVNMDDNDVITEAISDQDVLRTKGDCIQILIKSEKETFVWEFQIAPNGKKSCFFHMGAGRMFYPQPDFKYPAYTVKNTISNGKWEMQAAIPLTIFKEKGFKFTKDEKWTAIAVRYNFSRFLAEKETSSYPQAIGNVALPAYYAELILK